MSDSSPPRDRPLLVLGVGVACAVYSFGYDLWRLPPRIPYGTFGLTLGGDVLPLLAVPVAVVWLGLRDRLGRYGLRWPGARAFFLGTAAAFAAVLPWVVVLSQRPEFQAFYPSTAFPPAREGAVGLAVLWSVHHAPQLFATEFLYRGFLLFPLARTRGFPRALVFQLCLYVMLHWSKPTLELGQAAWGAAAFALVAWRTGSMLPAFAAHWLVAVTMDALCYAAILRT